ncbi:hypothetical protein Acr_22g0005650 [Actinidia rufa]|uniref:Uncharacterized protein n=1 Tax=Actinidia rufa TaxID=165716 RepID=A0A7J0GK27_9ERIC|nr:hypothetical protein Acr_22g0005650 [Actinidia rufa]
MELNWAQLFVYDDAALAQFYADHNIPDDVLIERSGPSEDANLVDGKGKGAVGVVGDKEEDAKVEEGEEVNQGEDQVPDIDPLAQILTTEPILVLSLDSEVADDLEFPEVTNADTSRDHETCLALENAILLPQDVADLSMEGLKEFKHKLIMQDVQILQRAVTNSERLKKCSTDLKKAN